MPIVMERVHTVARLAPEGGGIASTVVINRAHAVPTGSDLPKLTTAKDRAQKAALFTRALQNMKTLAGKLGGRSESGYWIEFFERRREGVREAPECASFEFRMSRAEVEIVNLACQVLRSV